MPVDDAIAIQVEDLHKTFRIPSQRVDSLKERAVHPFASREHRELRALDGISFEIQQGEFFGIVGRNGSGKSTLLKLLASIYRADSGTIRIAGRLAPFIELGVGFNHELTARENVVLNGVMMGLTPREMRRREDTVIEFAELQDFADLKLKNYSSGMLVRLAFSVMMEADADVLLIDEVLAVGDASFQQKCADAFHQMKGQGKTIVLVTHEMSTVEEYCHRAMLVSGGRIEHIGDPAEVGRRYVQLNFEQGTEVGTPSARESSDEVRLRDAWMEDENGDRVATVEQGDPIKLRLDFEVLRDSEGFGVGLILADAEGVIVWEFGTESIVDGDTVKLQAGRQIRIAATVENPLVAGRYFLHCGVNRLQGGVALYVQEALDFVVFGGPSHSRGIVILEHEIKATVDPVEKTQ